MKNIVNNVIPVSDITCNTPCTIEPAELQHAAQLIISCGGVINPIIVRVTGRRGLYDTYEVISGTNIYHAAVEAAKIDKAASQINVFIVENNSPAILDQVKLFRG